MPHRRYSLITRLSHRLLLWVGCAWIVMACGVGWYVHKEISDRFDESLVESARLLLDIAVHQMQENESLAEINQPRRKEVDDSDSARVEGVYVIYQVLDGAGEVIFHSEGAPATRMVPDLRPGFKDSDKWRMYMLRHITSDYYVVAADTHTNRYVGFAETMTWLLFLLFVLLPGILLAIRGVTKAELGSVKLIASEIAARGGSNLAPIVVNDLSTELGTISDSTNHLLARLDNALKIERALAATAAHELRTPLASARISLRAMQSHPMSDEAREACLQLGSNLETLVRRAEKLLEISQAEAGAAYTQERVDVGVLARMVVGEISRSAKASARLLLSVPEGEPITALGDMDTLAIALRNLIENSLKFGGPSNVMVQVSRPASISVRDNGAGVSAQDMLKLRMPRMRLSTNLPGYGLGLSIVRTIMEKHGGQLTLNSPPHGQSHGFEAVLTLVPDTHTSP
jgi:two-component system, OmpR family, sensor kinase